MPDETNAAECSSRAVGAREGDRNLLERKLQSIARADNTLRLGYIVARRPIAEKHFAPISGGAFYQRAVDGSSVPSNANVRPMEDVDQRLQHLMAGLPIH
jgi:hypothetical protein